MWKLVTEESRVCLTGTIESIRLVLNGTSTILVAVIHLHFPMQSIPRIIDPAHRTIFFFLDATDAQARYVRSDHSRSCYHLR